MLTISLGYSISRSKLRLQVHFQIVQSWDYRFRRCQIENVQFPLIKTVVRNGLALILLAGCSFGYLDFAGAYLGGDFAPILNLMIVPTLFGIAGYVIFSGPFAVKLLLLATLPVAHVIYFGGDPAKPGLENVVAVAEFVFFAFGSGLAALANKILEKGWFSQQSEC